MNRKLLSVVLMLFAIFSLFSCSKKSTSTEELDENMIVLENFLLIDGTGAQPIKDKAILIKGNKIVNVSDKKDLEIPENSTKLDLNGSTLLPGIINSHVHNAYDQKKLQNWVNSGVTTVRDMSARNLSENLKTRDELNKNPQNAHLVSATPIITAPDGYGRLPVDSPASAKSTVNNMIDKNVDIIKFALEDDLQGRKWPILSPELAKAIVDTAHERNKKAAVHISHNRNLRAAIDAGVDEISHMVVDKLDNNSIEDIVKKGIYFVPTLELWSGVSRMHNLKWDSVAAENLYSFYKAGGKFALGTDFEGYTCTFDQGFPITEVSLMQKAGIPNMDIIVSATKNAAFVCDLDKVLGTIEEGKQADILVVSGNPLEDITALANTQLVIHDGEIVLNKAFKAQN